MIPSALKSPVLAHADINEIIKETANPNGPVSPSAAIATLVKMPITRETTPPTLPKAPPNFSSRLPANSIPEEKIPDNTEPICERVEPNLSMPEETILFTASTKLKKAGTATEAIADPTSTTF